MYFFYSGNITDPYLLLIILKIKVMKTISMLLVAILTTFATFAQKSKADSAIKNAPIVVAQYTCPIHPDVVSDKPGKCSKCGMDLVLSKKEQMKLDVTKATYTCPMHQQVISDKSGNCPYCNAKLVVDRRSSKQRGTVYTCPMHPNVTVTEEGKCPICGLALQPKAVQKDSSQMKL